MARKGKGNSSGVSGNDYANEKERAAVMIQALMLDITPEMYEEFYTTTHEMIGNLDKDMQMDLFDNCDYDDDIMQSDMMLPPVITKRAAPAEPLKDADRKTLTLKVQMRDVKKPPMWREIKVPANFTFLQLHQAIQAVTGFMDYHLWQFQRQPYNPDLQIGIPQNDNDMGLEEWTDDASETGLTAYLAKKGDKLVYIYDFGDDWIFDVSVVEIGRRDGDTAEMTRWKGDLQPVEDSGGVWSYLQLRDGLSQSGSLKPKQKSELARDLGFDSYADLIDLAEEHMIDPEFINETLAEI